MASLDANGPVDAANLGKSIPVASCRDGSLSVKRNDTVGEFEVGCLFTAALTLWTPLQRH